MPKRIVLAGSLCVLMVGALGMFPTLAQAPRAAIAQPELPIRVLFVGDLMLDRNVARQAAASSTRALFATSTLELFKAADLRVANLEGTITNNSSMAQRNNKILRFTFTPTLAKEVLTLLDVSIVSLANNHTLDFGQEGYESTREYLQEWGVAHFGHPQNAQPLSTKVELKGKTFCLVGYHGVWGASTEPVVSEIQRLRSDCWRIIVFPHWGPEYELRAAPSEVGAGHAFIDAGADLVVGAHPHVVQNYEIYKDRAIFYSLGNFMFDQNFSTDVQRGLAVRVDFRESRTDFALTSLNIINQHASVAGGAVAEFHLP